MIHRSMSARRRTWGGAGLLAVLLALSLSAAHGSGVTPSYQWMDLYSGHSTMAGVPLPVGSYVAVFDPQGTQCGEKTLTTPGIITILPCYGDDSNTPTDEGAVEGDLLTFYVDGTLATTSARTHYFAPVAADTPIAWKPLDLWEVDLLIPPQLHASITQAPGLIQLAWQPAGGEVTLYQVWRSEDFYFVPGDEGSEPLGTVPATGAPLVWPDSAGVGNPELNYAYRVVGLDADSQIIEVSQAVAEFDYVLYSP